MNLIQNSLYLASRFIKGGVFLKFQETGNDLNAPDLITVQNFRNEVELSDYQLPSGQSLVYNARIVPMEVVVEGICSDMYLLGGISADFAEDLNLPLSPDVPRNIENIIASALPGASQAINITNTLLGRAGSRVAQVYKKLLDAFKALSIFKLYSNLGVFDNMIIRDINAETGGDELGDNLKLTLTLRQIYIINETDLEFYQNLKTNTVAHRGIRNTVSEQLKPTVSAEPSDEGSLLFQARQRIFGNTNSAQKALKTIKP